MPPASSPPDAPTGPATQHTVTIEDMRPNGAGRAWIDGRSIDVFGADLGEVVRVEVDADPIETHHRRRLPARLLAVLAPSPHRVEPRCPHVPTCPGCPVRMLSPARRFEHAERRARAVLASAVAPDAQWSRLPGAGDDDSRARAVARALVDAQGQLTLGMARVGGRPIALSGCPLQTARVREVVGALERDLRRLGLRPWDRMTRTGTLRHVVVHAVGDRARAIVAVDLDAPDLPVDEVLADRADVDLWVDVLPRRGAGLFKRPRLLRGQPWLELVVDQDVFRVSPRSWIPQSPSTTPTVRRQVARWIGREAPGRTIEVGCGVGILTLPLARLGGEVIGIDIERDAVLDAEHNLQQAGLENARVRVGEAGHALRRLRRAGHGADTVVLHAMRQPFGAEAMGHVAALAPRRIVYLAPSATSLARDLEALPGYRATEVALVDQTPGTLADLVMIHLVAR